jgi:hypothetical protein
MKHDRRLRASVAAFAAPFEQKDAGITDPAQAIEKLAGAFEAFKSSHAEEMSELKTKGATDPVLVERLGKIETALESATEAKAAIDAAIAAERKEREELELRLQRDGIKGDGDGAKRRARAQDLQPDLLAAQASEQKTAAVELDAKGYDEYKAAFNRFMRKNDRLLSPDEVKTLQVGSDPDGGYLVTPDISGRMAKKVYETSPIRQLASVQVDLDRRARGHGRPRRGRLRLRRRARHQRRRHHAAARQVADPGVHHRHRAQGDPAAARRRGDRRRGWLADKVATSSAASRTASSSTAPRTRSAASRPATR